jgi:hypothetical protein
MRLAALLDGLAARHRMLAANLELLVPRFDLCAQQAASYRQRARRMQEQAAGCRQQVWQLWTAVGSLDRARRELTATDAETLLSETFGSGPETRWR